MKVIARQPVFDESIWLLISSDDGQLILPSENVILRPLDRTKLIDRPGLTLTPEAAQQLMNGLWDCGIRPAQGKGSAGQLEAVRAHLEDIRRLVFHQLGVPDV